MICLDISNSMNVRDINNESRLEVSKRLLNGEVFTDDCFIEITKFFFWLR